jgi:ubiquinone/menaquinone biosynthesis C-methylase UbiE
LVSTKHGSRVTLRKSTSANSRIEINSAKDELVDLFSSMTDPVLCCPVSREALVKTERFIGAPVEKWFCPQSGRAYRRSGPFIDLVPADASPKAFWERSLQEVVQTDTFRNPLTAFLYERGWRQGFANAGFPGVDAEFELLLDFFGKGHEEESTDEATTTDDGTPIMKGTLLDMSCGSGLMSRRLAKEGSAARLISADYSEAMLLETKRRFDEEKERKPTTPSSSSSSSSSLQEEETLPLILPELIRCDVAQLPLKSSSVDGCHAGAAVHCWPQLEEGLAEVARVLKPGGRFFATTFKKGAYGLPRQANSQGGASFRFFEAAELEALLKAAGFAEANVELVGQGCLIARCVK